MVIQLDTVARRVQICIKPRDTDRRKPEGSGPALRTLTGRKIKGNKGNKNNVPSKPGRVTRERDRREKETVAE